MGPLLDHNNGITRLKHRGRQCARAVPDTRRAVSGDFYETSASSLFAWHVGQGATMTSSLPTERLGPAYGYQPALDGIRALAVAAVLIFHGGVGLLPGG